MKQIIDLGEHRITIETKANNLIAPNHDPLKYGIYIALSNRTIIKPSDYKEGMSTEGVVLHTEHASIVISKLDHLDKLTHDEAVKIGVFSRHEAIEHDLHRKEISDALIMIGGEPLKDEWYWLQGTTEYYTSNAWTYGGANGYVSNLNKVSNLYVRQVSALKDFLNH